MLYEKYERKIRVLAKIKHIVYKFRFILLGVAVAASAAIVSTNLITGTISAKPKEYGIPEVLSYGDDYSPSASARMKGDNTYFEYAKKSENKWTIDKPFAVGSYLARPYSFNGFGAKVTGSVFEFTIAPREFEISIHQNSITYGDKLSIDVSNLANEDYVADYEIVYEGDDLYEKEVSIKEESIVVKNSYGEVVNSSYKPVIKKHSLKINKKAITITFSNESKIYDGNSLSGSYNTIGLVDGDNLTLKKELNSILDIGSIANTASNSDFVITRSSDNADVTSYYDITVVSGELAITARPLTVSSSSIFRSYNGYPLTDEGENPELTYSITNGELLSGHHIDITFDNKGVYQAITSQNTFTYVVRDDKDNDVSNLYNLKSSYGSINISKLNVTIESPSISREYNKENLTGIYDESHKYITSGSIAETDSIVTKDIPTIVNPGTIDNFLDFDIVNPLIGDSFDKSLCYNITYKYGQLTITKIPLTITTNNFSKTYDGVPLSSSGNNPSLTLGYNNELLVGDHHLEYSFECEGQRNTCNSLANKLTYKILDENNQDVTNLYYDVTEQFGSVTIDKRKISLSTSNYEKYYDGQSYSINDNSQIDGLDDLAYGDEFEILNSTKSTLPTNGAIKVDVSYSIMHNGLDVKDNYEISEDFGTFNIKKRVINITTNTVERFYDGERMSEFAIDQEHSLSYDVEFQDDYGMLPGHELRIAFDNEGTYITNNGDEINNSITYGIFETGGTTPISDWNALYQINVNLGTLKIKKLPAKITSDSSEKVYDGEIMTNTGFNVEGLLSCDQAFVSFDNTAQAKDVTTGQGITNSFTYVINNNGLLNGENVSNCYDVTTDFGSLIINPRAIVVEMPSFDITYDGYYHSITEFNSPKIAENSPNDLASRDSLTAIDNTSFINAGEYLPSEQESKVAIYCNDEDVTKDYEITYIRTASVIHKKPIKVSMNSSFTKKYDGKALSDTFSPYSYINIVGGLVGNDTYVVNYTPDPIKPSIGSTSLSVEIYTGDGKVNTTNYDISFEEIKIDYEIQSNSLIIETLDVDSRIYDGTINVAAKYECSGMYPNHALYLNSYVDSYRPGTYQYKIDKDSFKIMDLELNTYVDPYDYYSDIIFVETGTISITPRKINVIVNGTAYTYDGNSHSLLDDVALGGDLLAKGDSLDINKDKDDFVTFFGDEATSLFTTQDIIITNNSEDRSDCYTINVSNSSISVAKANLIITSNSFTKTFNNRPTTDNDLRITVYKGGLALTDEIYTSFDSIGAVNVGEYTNSFNIQIAHNGEISEKAFNSYNITLNYGKITINPLVVTYSCLPHSHTYNGTSIKVDSGHLTSSTSGFAYISNGYVSLNNTGYSIYAEFDSTDIIYAGDYQLYPTLTIYNERHEVDTYGNVQVIEGKSAYVPITINKLNITISNSTNNNEMIYIGCVIDGEYSIYGNDGIDNSVYILGSNLAVGDKLNLDTILVNITPYSDEITTNKYGDTVIVRTYEAADFNAALASMIANGQITITNKLGRDVTGSYAISFNCVSVRIEYDVF